MNATGAFVTNALAVRTHLAMLGLVIGAIVIAAFVCVVFSLSALHLAGEDLGGR